MPINKGLGVNTTPPGVSSMTHLIADEGIGLVILGCVVVLSFLYFWRQINKKSVQEKTCDAHGNTLTEIIKRLQSLREDMLEIKIMITGTFRNVDKGDKE